MNAYGGVIHFFRQSIGRGHEFFSAIRIRKSADLIPDAYKCVFGKGGCYFSHPDGGGHAILSSRNRGVNVFFLLRGAVCHPPPLRWNLWTVPKWWTQPGLVYPRPLHSLSDVAECAGRVSMVLPNCLICLMDCLLFLFFFFYSHCFIVSLFCNLTIPDHSLPVQSIVEAYSIIFIIVVIIIIISSSSSSIIIIINIRRRRKKKRRVVIWMDKYSM